MPARRHQVWGVVLAAGESERMGRSKAMLPLGRKTFLERVLEPYSRLGVPACVVLGANAATIRRAIAPRRVRVVQNPEPQLGPLNSLRLACRELSRASALIVHPVDHPLVWAATVERLLEAHRRRPDCILIPRAFGRKGHPVLFPSRFFGEFRKAPLEEGARWVVHRHEARVRLLSTADEGILANLNTPGQLRWWRQRLSPRW